VFVIYFDKEMLKCPRGGTPAIVTKSHLHTLPPTIFLTLQKGLTTVEWTWWRNHRNSNCAFGYLLVLNMTRLPVSAIQNRIRIGLDFENISTGSDMDIQTALITAVEYLIRGLFGYKPDWIKYLDSGTGLGLDWITHWKYWTRLESEKSSIRSTLLLNPKFNLRTLRGPHF